jgi:hypothetical protein
MSKQQSHYALIIGNGRSGTNWLLTMLDASDRTHCRNEPQEILQSPYHQLPDPPLIGDTAQQMAEKWDQFVEWSAQTMGERDLKITNPKHHVYPWSQKLGIAYLPVRPKVQSLFRPVVPALQRGEWPMPGWIANRDRLQQALAVLKVNDLKAWTADWIFQHRPEVPVIHITRHPGGQLNSGIKRFFSILSPQEQDAERLLYQNILKQAVTVHPEWADIFGAIDQLSLVEAVAWFWRYNNEMIFRVGQHSPHYLPVVYEDLVQNPLHYAQKIYALCEIPWTPEAEAIIQEGLGTSVWGDLDKTPIAVAYAWKQKLAPEYQAIAQTVLQGSLMEQWWTNEVGRTE